MKMYEFIEATNQDNIRRHRRFLVFPSEVAAALLGASDPGDVRRAGSFHGSVPGLGYLSRSDFSPFGGRATIGPPEPESWGVVRPG
jgi:hypothetical protein